MRRDVFLHNAESSADLLSFCSESASIAFGVSSRGPISVIGNTSSATAASCQFRNSIRMMPAISSRNGNAALLANVLIEFSKAEGSMENRDRISPRWVRAK